MPFFPDALTNQLAKRLEEVKKQQEEKEDEVAVSGDGRHEARSESEDGEIETGWDEWEEDQELAGSAGAGAEAGKLEGKEGLPTGVLGMPKMVLVSQSYETRFRPGTVFEVPMDVGRAFLAQNLASKIMLPKGGDMSRVSILREKSAIDKAKDNEIRPWPMKVTPTKYLELWPEGPKADLARAHIRLRDELMAANL